MTDPSQRWDDVQPLPDRQGQVQQMDYLDGYILALQDALRDIAAIAMPLGLQGSHEQMRAYRKEIRRTLVISLNAAQAKLKEIRDPVVLRTIRHSSCVDILCGNPDPHTHL